MTTPDDMTTCYLFDLCSLAAQPAPLVPSLDVPALPFALAVPHFGVPDLLDLVDNLWLG